MDQEAIQILIKSKYSGAMTDAGSYLGIMLQTAGVIFGGIVIWRASIIFQKKKEKERKRTDFFETSYSKNWKRRR